jgi:glycosyltransferase involved in cell wall biosynthesis
MTNPLISIVIPTMNEEEFIPRLLQNIILQKYRPIEIIFVDGGSTDGTRALLRKAVQATSNFSLSLNLIFEENYPGCLCPAHAKNIGIRVSLGEHVILLDADTIFKDENSLRKLKNALNLFPFVIAKAEIQADTHLEELISYQYSRYYHIGYQRSIFETILFNEDLGFGEDRDIWFRIKRDLGIEPYTFNEALLIRHLPHTKTEYFNQIKWYARTYDKFVENMLKEREFPYLSEAIATYGGSLLGFFVPFFLLLSLSKDLDSRDRIPTSVFLLNTKRRYFFMFYFFLSSSKILHAKNFSACISVFLLGLLKRLKQVEKKQAKKQILLN